MKGPVLESALPIPIDLGLPGELGRIGVAGRTPSWKSWRRVLQGRREHAVFYFLVIKGDVNHFKKGRNVKPLMWPCMLFWFCLV